MADGEDVIRADEEIDLAGDELVAAVGRLLALDRVQDGEQRVAILLDLGALVAVARVLDGELVQAELLRHLVELLERRLEQRDPDEAIALAHVLADVLSGDVGELAAILVGNAADQHARRRAAPRRTLRAPGGQRTK